MSSTGPRPEGRITLVYIVAPSHSGSTLLAMLMGCHPEICTVGELKATALGDPGRYRCSCLREIRKCPFWNGIADDMSAMGLRFTPADPGTHFASLRSPYARRLLRPLCRGPLLEAARETALSLSPEWRRTLPEILRQNEALVECIAARSGKRFVVDSSKVGIRLKYLLRIPSIDVKVIRMVRDGRGVALAHTNQDEYADSADPAFRGGGTGASAGTPGLTVADAAMLWRRSVEEGLAISRALGPGRVAEVRYESLCTDPDGELARLFAFLGVPGEKVLAGFRTVEQHVIGNGMRLDRSPEVRLDDRWRRDLVGPSLATFERTAGRLNRMLGYR